MSAAVGGIVAAFASPQASASGPPSGPTTAFLRGCWTLDPNPDRKGQMATFCFNPTGYVSGVMIAQNMGTDFCAKWRTDGPKLALLYFGSDPEACDFRAGADGRSFELSACRDAGHWRRDREFGLESWPCDASSYD